MPVMPKSEINDWPALRRHYVALQESLVYDALAKSGGNKQRAADMLRMHRRQLQRICERCEGAKR